MNLLPCAVKTLVYDFGSYSTQFGFAGDAQPRFNIPSSAAQIEVDEDSLIRFNDFWLQKKAQSLEIQQCIDDTGAVADANILTSFLDWTYQSCLTVEPSEYHIIITQPSHLTANRPVINKWKESFAEACFEFAQHPAIYFEHDSVLSCFSRALHTGTIVDFGWSCFRVIPILEGRPLLKSMIISKTGGCQLCSILLECLRKNHIAQNPQNRIPPMGQFIPIGTSPSIPYFPQIFDSHNDLITKINVDNPYVPTISQQRYCTKAVLQDMITSCLSFQPPAADNSDADRYIYFMPNRESVNLQKEMQYLRQILLWPQKTIQASKPIPECIAYSISNNNTPADVRRQLWANIVPSGGLSILPGLYTELETIWETRRENKLKPANYTAKVIPPKNRLTGGYNTAWVGGSIIGSMDNFADFCITKEQYDENGLGIFLKSAEKK